MVDSSVKPLTRSSPFVVALASTIVVLISISATFTLFFVAVDFHGQTTRAEDYGALGCFLILLGTIVANSVAAALAAMAIAFSKVRQSVAGTIFVVALWLSMGTCALAVWQLFYRHA